MQGPRCSIRSKNMYSDVDVDYPKMLLLNLPGVLLVSASCVDAVLLCSTDCIDANPHNHLQTSAHILAFCF